MALPITIPRLGWNMEEGIFAGWLKHDGDEVRAGDLIYRLESDKATQDIECLDSGILRIPPDSPREGDSVAVGAVLAYLVQPGEVLPIEGQLVDVKTAAEPTRKVGGSVQASKPGDSRIDAAPAGDRSAAPVSPRARRIAAELGVDWTEVKGTGRTGRIREKDVRAAAPGRREAPAQAPAPVSSIRRTIAARMMESRRATAPVTLTTTADAANLVSLRKQFQAAGGLSPTYTDIIVKLCARALREHPSLNARWEDERVVLLPDIDIGIAVDTPAGLYVPVLRNVSMLGVRELAARSSELIERARKRELKNEEMRGSTFTVTSLGPLGIDAFTPIINYPECAILGIGCIRRQPVVRDEQIAIGEQMTLSLTFDHRVVDGAPAARFLQYLAGLIENPAAFLAT
jgi:pyruvate dehydrogenase E2 component (dihydrolipoamide acetyltransferase)